MFIATAAKVVTPGQLLKQLAEQQHCSTHTPVPAPGTSSHSVPENIVGIITAAAWNCERRTLAGPEDGLLRSSVALDRFQGRQNNQHALGNCSMQPAAVLQLIQAAADHEVHIQQQQHLQSDTA